MLFYKMNTFYYFFREDVGREVLRRALKRAEKAAGL